MSQVQGLILGTRMYYRFYPSAVETDAAFTQQVDGLTRGTCAAFAFGSVVAPSDSLTASRDWRAWQGEPSCGGRATGTGTGSGSGTDSCTSSYYACASHDADVGRSRAQLQPEHADVTVGAHAACCTRRSD